MLAGLTFLYQRPTAGGGRLTDAPPNLTPGDTAPQFKLTTLEGETVTLAQLQGRPLWLSFWSVSCGPCQAQMPDLVTMSRQAQSAGVQLLTINAGDQPEEIRTYLQHTGYSVLPVALDEDFSATAAYHVYYMPSHVFIGADGRVRRVEARELTGEEMRDALETLR